MKAIYLPSLRQLKHPQFWLLSLATALVVIHFTLIWRTENLSTVAMSPLFYLAVASLLWEKRQSFRLETTVSSAILGALLITWVLINSPSATTGRFLLIFPFISGLGLSLLASGFKGLKLYRRELIVLFFLGTPKALISSFFDISVLTAKFSTFLLWYSGFKVTVQGVHIILPTGTVEVRDGCSGLNTITYVLGLAVIFLAMFPLARSKQILVTIVAVTLGFVVNGVRVALLAIFVASSNQQSFKYWHESTGSYLFGMISVFLLGLFCLFLLRQEEEEYSNDDSVEL